MLSVIRRLIHSKVGLVITFGFLAIIGLAFAATDITGLQSTGAPSGDSVVTVGKAKLSGTELRARAQDALESYRQQQPNLDMGQFVSGGGLEATMNQLVAGLALEQFGRDAGFVVSKRSVDGQIASIPALQGTDGTFSQLLYDRLLQERKLTDAQVRADITRETIARQMILPTIGASQVPSQLALPYASLSLEKREGQIGIIPTRAIPAGPAPTDAELAAWYKRNIARYTIPERRIVRYAVVTGDQIKAQTTPSEAELTAAYQSQRASFEPSEKRTFQQVIVSDQAAANAIAAKLKAGTAIAEAARAAGLEPSTFTATDKATYAKQSNAAVVEAIFGAAKGGIVGPVRGPLGYTVARIDDVVQVPGKTFAQARTELLAAVTKEKTQQVLGKIHDAIDDAAANRATFDEIVADQKLEARTTPPLLGDGRDPSNPAIKAAPDFVPVVAAAFAAEQGDAPQMVPLGTDGGFAVVSLGRVVAPAAPPLGEVRAVVARDLALDKARRQARAIAAGIVAKAGKGGSFPALFAASGVKTPPLQPMKAGRAQLAANPRGAPPPLTLLFSMSEGTTKLLEAPNNEGWFVVHLDRIERGNAAGQKAVIDQQRATIGQSVGREYAEQFTQAVQAKIGVKKNDKGIAALKAELGGAASARLP
ncbi:peptidylprolyl isomerase [Sphingomonas hylomeconis]|uniref:Parvulin-like PPIase n=1 Tax=Sphingomonas hylomeconis TaxID=1395958 RepID=A0ABV7SX65_9SPHN|nr:peptidylprolyl isomerase [Sphingomonas hylomeconis]